MDRRSWPWKKKSSDKSGADKAAAASDSLGVLASTGSQGDKVKQDSYKKPNYVQISVESYSHLTGLEDQVKSYEDQVKSYEEQVKRYDDQQLIYEDQIKSLEDEVKDLNEQLSAAHSEMTTKENLVKQHAKVAEEAVSGWEKAEAEAATLKNHLESVTLLKLTAEDRASHLDGALKECMRQIRNLKEEHEQNLHDVVLAKTKQWDRIKHEFEAKIHHLDQELLRSAAENAAVSRSLQDRSDALIKTTEQKARAEADIELLKSNIDSCEREINSLKYELHIVAKELEIRNEEKNMSLRSAEAANKQHMEGVKKIAKLEAECQRLRGLVRKKLPGPAALAQMKLEVDNLGETRVRRSPVKPHSPHFSPVSDFSLDTVQKYQKENDLLKERILAMEDETKMLKEALAKRNTELQASRNICAKTVSKLQSLEAQLQSDSQHKAASLASFSEEGNDDSVSVSGSWATALISELPHVKKDKSINSPQRSENANHLELMDDFLEMEKLACSSHDSHGTVPDSEKPELDPSEKLNGDPRPDEDSLQSRITLLLKSLPKDADSEKVFEEITRAVQSVCLIEEKQNAKDQELAAAVSQIHDFVLTLEKEAKSVLGTSTEDDVLIQKLEEFSVVGGEIDLNRFLVCLSGILGKAGKLRFSFVGYENNDAEASSPDCVDKVALPENKANRGEAYSNGCTQFSDSTSSHPDVPHDGNSDLNVPSCKWSLKEFEQLKLEKDQTAADLARCTESLEATESQLHETEHLLAEVKSQLTAAQKSNGLAETQLKCMAESYNSLEVRSEELQSRVQVLESKIDTLDNELREERRNREDAEARCKDLQEQLQRMETSPAADPDAKNNQEQELAAAAEKLAECQETIFLLGKQLNGMRPPTDVTGSPFSEHEHEVTTSIPFDLGNESPIHTSDSEPTNPNAPKTSKHRPTKSGSSSTPEKNGRGFSRFFSSKAK